MTLLELVTAIDDFFFEYTVAAWIPAIMRVGLCATIVISFIQRIDDTELFLDPEGICGDETYKSLTSNFPQLDFLIWLPAWMRPPRLITTVLIALGCLAGIGIFTPLTLLLFFAVVSSVQSRTFLAMFSGGDSISRMLLICLLCTDSAATLSVDSMIEPRESQIVEGWPIRLIQVYICCVYFWSAIHKFYCEYWMRGVAVRNALRSRIWSRGLPTRFFEKDAISKILTHSTLIFEFFAPMTIWIEDLRLPSVLMAISFHVGITIFLRIGYFGPLMIVALVSFL